MTQTEPAEILTPRDHRFRILLSYHYFRNTNMEELFAKLFGGGPYPECFADSGAFSALTQNAPIDVDEYARWLKQWGHLFHVYSNLDVIGDGETSAKGTWENQKRLEGHGLTPLPVFHAGEPWSALDRLLDAGYNYIALGGLVGRPKKAVLPWAVRCMQIGRDRAVFHGFGMTSWEILAALPWYSVDSSSWVSGAMFAKMDLFDERWGRFVPVRNTHGGVYDGEGARLIRSYGFDPTAFTTAGPHNRPLICALSAVSWQRAETWVRKKHGPIVIPQSDRPNGLRWYCANTSKNLAQGAEGLRLYLADAVPRDFRFVHEHRNPAAEEDPQ